MEAHAEGNVVQCDCRCSVWISSRCIHFLDMDFVSCNLGRFRLAIISSHSSYLFSLMLKISL
jgi:hypothetical protein